MDRDIAELVAIFTRVTEFDQFITEWIKNQDKLKGYSLLHTFNDIGTNFPQESAVVGFQDEKFYVRSVFSKSYGYFLNTDIWMSMTSAEKVEVPVLSVICFDTQFGRYAEKYLKDKSFKEGDLGKSFHALVKYIFKNDITFDFVFYLIENYSNFLSGDLKQIKNQVFALKKFADLDRKRFLETGEVVLPYSSDELVNKVEELLASYVTKEQKEEYTNRLYIQNSISLVILKSALLRPLKLSKEEKVLKLVEFLDQNISAILLRELFVCGNWICGENYEFFDPINGGDSLFDLPKKIDGMAWDFMLLRHVEQYCSLREDDRHTIAYYSSFDRRLVEVSDCFKNKGCLYPPKIKSNKFYMLSDVEFASWLENLIGKEKNIQIFNNESAKKRSENRPSCEELSALRRKLEYKLMKSFSPKSKKK